MSTVTVKVRVQDETARVAKAMKAATITSLGKAAAYVRGIARQSISRKKKTSLPGKPPHSPTGRLRNSIAFNVDKEREQAVIGPVRAAVAFIGHTHEFGGTEPPKPPKKGRPNTMAANQHVGGVGPIRTQGRGGGKRDRLVFAKLNTPAQVERSKEIVAELALPPSVTGAPSKAQRKYPPRPFMAPALTRGRDRLPGFWRNSVRGG